VEGADAGSDRHEKGPLQELVTAWRRSSGKGPAANVVPPWDERMQATESKIIRWVRFYLFLLQWWVRYWLMYLFNFLVTRNRRSGTIPLSSKVHLLPSIPPVATWDEGEPLEEA